MGRWKSMVVERGLETVNYRLINWGTVWRRKPKPGIYSSHWERMSLDCLRQLLKDILSTSKVFKDFIEKVFGLMMRMEVEVVSGSEWSPVNSIWSSNLLISQYVVSQHVIVPSKHTIHTVKRIVQQKNLILSSFTYPLVPNLYDFLISPCGTQIKIPLKANRVEPMCSSYSLNPNRYKVN